MSMDKYYTPSIEEFCMGFEFEVYSERDFEEGYSTWDEHVINCIEEALIFERSLILDNTRVKYLDIEDIESLGFTQVGSLWFENKELDCRIRKWKQQEVDIYAGWGRLYGNDLIEHRVFKGSIRNKSEFRRVLKQVII